MKNIEEENQFYICFNIRGGFHINSKKFEEKIKFELFLREVVMDIDCFCENK